MNQNEQDKWEILAIIIRGLYLASLGGTIFLLLSIPWLFLRAEFYTLHNSIIPLEESTYNALMFLLLGMLKLFVIVFLLLPAVGLHLALARHRKSIHKPE